MASKSFVIDGKRYAYGESLEPSPTYKPITQEVAKRFLQVVLDARQGKVSAKDVKQAISSVQDSFDIVGFE